MNAVDWSMLVRIGAAAVVLGALLVLLVLQVMLWLAKDPADGNDRQE